MKYLLPLLTLALSLNAMAMGPAALDPEKPVIHETVSGEAYVRDSNFPALGTEAYRDPRGLIWGELRKDKNGPLKVTEADAEKYCASLNEEGSTDIRLPTMEELRLLANDLGMARSHFSVYIQSESAHPPLFGQKTQILPDLAGNYIWASTASTDADDVALANSPSSEDPNALVGPIGYAFSGDNIGFDGKALDSNPLKIAQRGYSEVGFRCVAHRK